MNNLDNQIDVMVFVRWYWDFLVLDTPCEVVWRGNKSVLLITSLEDYKSIRKKIVMGCRYPISEIQMIKPKRK